MDNENQDTLKDELRPEYDEAFLKGGVRGKYAKQYAIASNIVRLAPDVADTFPNEKSVNEALRTLLRTQSERAESEDVGQFFRDSDTLLTDTHTERG